MQLIDKIFGIDTLKAELKALQTGAMLSQMQNISQTVYPTWGVWKEIETYRIQDDVYSVVNRLARTSAMIPMYGYDLAEQTNLKTSDKISIFLRQLTLKQKIEMYTFLYLTGEVFIWKDKLIGANARVEKIHFFHPSYTTVFLSKTFPVTVIGYGYEDVNAGHKVQFIPPEEMVYIKYFNPTTDLNLSFRGLSPIKVLAMTLDRLKAGKSASVAQLQNGGTPGVLYLDTDNMNKKDTVVANAIKEAYARFSNNSDNKGAPFVYADKLGYISMGLPLADLEVADLAKIDFKKICNAYAISDTLFNNDSASTESNVKEMIRLMYTNAILPNLRMVQDAFNTEILPDFGGTEKEVRYDLSDITELQEDMKAKADAFAALPVMIPNNVLEAFGYERDPNPAMDQPLIKSGYQTIDDLQPVDPLDDEDEDDAP